MARRRHKEPGRLPHLHLEGLRPVYGSFALHGTSGAHGGKLRSRVRALRCSTTEGNGELSFQVTGLMRYDWIAPLELLIANLPAAGFACMASGPGLGLHSSSQLPGDAGLASWVAAHLEGFADKASRHRLSSSRWMLSWPHPRLP